MTAFRRTLQENDRMKRVKQRVRVSKKIKQAWDPTRIWTSSSRDARRKAKRAEEKKQEKGAAVPEEGATVSPDSPPSQA
jgi:hypothetical protein